MPSRDRAYHFFFNYDVYPNEPKVLYRLQANTGAPTLVIGRQFFSPRPALCRLDHVWPPLTRSRPSRPADPHAP